VSFWSWLRDTRTEYQRLSSESNANALNKAARRQERRAVRRSGPFSSRRAGKAAERANALREAARRERERDG
jgi:hypothetical protein